jgi:sugar phosphate isomerase/epimerase
MDAENIRNDGCSQRDSAEHKGYVRAHRSFNRIWKERKYSNYLNTFPQVAEMLDRVNMPNASLMADFRHMVWNEENFQNLSACRKYLNHVHMDFPLTWPERPYLKADDEYNYQSFLEALKQSAYNDTLTIEADIPKDWKQAHAQAVEVLKSVL